MRPKELGSDTTNKLHVLQHIVKCCEKQENTKYDIIVDLDPTAPLRKQNFLEESYTKFMESEANNLYSVSKARKNPYFSMVELDQNGYAHLSKKSDVVRRQDAKIVYEMNASIYIYNRDFLLKTNTIHSDKTIIYEMPELASIDIDTEIDFQFIEYLIKKEVFKFD